MLTLEYRILRKLSSVKSLPYNQLLNSRNPEKHIFDNSAVLDGMRDVGWISSTFSSGSTVSITSAGRLEYLREKQNRLSRLEDSARYVITTLIAAAAAFFAGAALFFNS